MSKKTTTTTKKPDTRNKLQDHLKGTEKQQGARGPGFVPAAGPKQSLGDIMWVFLISCQQCQVILTKTINKQLIIGTEKCFVWAKLRTTLITLRSCSGEIWFSAQFYVWSEQRISHKNIIPQGFKNLIGTYPMSQRGLGTWGGSLIIKGGCPRKGGI